MKQKQIVFTCLLMIFLVLVSVLAYAEPQPTMTVSSSSYAAYLLSLFSGNTFSVSNGPGSLPAYSAGQYYDLSFIYSCHVAGTQQRFNIDYREYSDTANRIGAESGWYTVSKSCAVGDWAQVSLNSFKVPSFSSQATNQYEIIIKHQILVNGVWTTDTGGKSNIDGFTDIALFQYVPPVNQCAGLTGTKVGSPYCYGNDVAQLFYNQYVVNNKCQTQQNIIQNCNNNVCQNGACVPPTPVCVETSWNPKTSDFCSDKTFTQTSNCNTQRSAKGTKDCSVTPPSCVENTWTPDPANYCSGVTFNQTSNCDTVKSMVGTKVCQPPVQGNTTNTTISDGSGNTNQTNSSFVKWIIDFWNYIVSLFTN